MPNRDFAGVPEDKRDGETLHIGLATHGDVDALCHLLQALFTQESEFEPLHGAQEMGLRAILEDSRTGEILVARRAARVVGMVNLLYTISTALGTRVAWLEDMVVHPEERRAGVGSALLRAALIHARGRDCQRVTLLTDATNEGAQRFYRRQGFTHSAMIPMRIMLPAAD